MLVYFLCKFLSINHLLSNYGFGWLDRSDMYANLNNVSIKTKLQTDPIKVLDSELNTGLPMDDPGRGE